MLLDEEGELRGSRCRHGSFHLAQELAHDLGCLGHARLNRVVGPGRIAEQLGLVVPHLKEALQELDVVVSPAIREEDVEVERCAPVLGVRHEGVEVWVVGCHHDLAVFHGVLLDVLLGEARKLRGQERERAGRRPDVDHELLANLGELRIVPAEQLLPFGWKVEAVAAEVAEGLGEQPRAFSLELLSLGSVRLDNRRDCSVEVQAGPQRVDLRIAELRGGTHQRVRVRDRHEVRELLRVSHFDHHVVQPPDGHRVGQLVDGRPGEGADLGEPLLGRSQVVVAQSSLSLCGEAVGDGVEGGRRRRGRSRSHDDRRRRGRRRGGLG